METPTFTIPIRKNVIIEILTSTVVVPNTVLSGYGQVKLVSDIVTQVSVGQNVFFKNGTFYTVGSDVFAVVDEIDILFIKTAAP